MSDRRKRELEAASGRLDTSKKPRSDQSDDSDKQALLEKIRQKKEALKRKLAERQNGGFERQEADKPRLEKSSATSNHAMHQKRIQNSAEERKPRSNTSIDAVRTGLNVPIHPLFSQLASNDEMGKPGSSSSESARASPEITRPNKYLEATEETRSGKEQIAKENPYLSNRSDDARARRARRGLVFNAPGKFIEQAEKLKREAQVEALKRKIEEKRKNSGLEVDMSAGERAYKPDAPPSVEWWDQAILTGSHESYDLDRLELDNENSLVTVYVQHPAPISPPWEKNLSKDTELFLTKKEFKRIRKNTRAEKHKETQDRIRLGLDPAPPPKIKLSNVMTIYTDEAVKDPTALEKRAREAVQERKEAHQQDNESRKLTSEQRYEKFVAKLEREKEKAVFSAVFRVEDFSDNRHKFLVNYNAKKLQLSGMVIFNEKFNLIVVEGGALAIRKFTRLLIERIKWTEAAEPREKDGVKEAKKDLSGNKCALIWTGQLKASKFMKWTLQDAETEQDAKDILSRNHAENYWIEAGSFYG